MDGPPAALQAAIDGFRSILTDDERNRLARLGAVPDGGEVAIFTAQLDRENQLRKGRGVAGRLMSFLQSVQAFSAVVDTFVSSKPEIAALVWGSVKFALLFAVNYASHFEALSHLFMTFSNHCPRFTEYQALYPGSARLQKALCDFHASIIRCCKHVIEAIRRDWKTQLMIALWSSIEKEFEPDTNELRTLAKQVTAEIKLAKDRVDHQEQELQALERAAASKHRSALQKILPKVGKEIDEIKQMQLRQSTYQSKKGRERLLDFLSAHNHLHPYRRAFKERIRDTAEWIFATPAFARWHDGTGSSLLWCSGKIGSGKTVLCGSVITRVLATKSDDAWLTYFFLQCDDSMSLTAETAIRSIIRQVLDIQPITDVERQLKMLSRKHVIEFDEWIDLTRQVIQSSTTFYVFIDGLDESDVDERRKLLAAISTLASACPGLRVFISSRDSVGMDLHRHFPHLERVSMLSTTLSPDISLYVEAAIYEQRRNEDWADIDPDLLDTIKERLTQHADGMFLWVKFLVDELCTASCDDEILHFLYTLPKDLEDTFRRAFSRITTRQRKTELVQKVFRWMAVAKRPLGLDELREAISIDIGQEYSMPGKLVHRIAQISTWCENLVQVSEEESRPVQFAHSTIRDFILKGQSDAPLAGFHVNLEEADHFAGEICVTYLHFNDFKTTVARRLQPLQVNPIAMADLALRENPRMGKLTTRLANLRGLGSSKAKQDQDLSNALATYGRAETDASLDNHPFLKYASQHWTSHTSNFSEERSGTWNLWLSIVAGDLDLACMPWENSADEQAKLVRSYDLHHYALLRNFSRSRQVQDSSAIEVLRIAAAADNDLKAINIFAESGITEDGKNRALQAACLHGNYETVEGLIAAGADANAAAPPQEYSDTWIKPIYPRGCRLFDTTIYGLTALGAALTHGHQEVVDLLIAVGANITTTLHEQGLLQGAIKRGSRRIMERMLDATTTANAARCGCLALQVASIHSDVQAVERLLAAGPLANTPDGLEALREASSRGHLEVVERLLAAGADINVPGSNGQTALWVASGGGHLQTVERLLAAGAEVDGPDSYRETALYAASEGGYLQVLERLLTAGANIDTPSSNGLTALWVASYYGHLQVVERLLAAGAMVDSPSFHGRTALLAASENGHLQVVERLLAARAKVDGGKGQPLVAASRNGHLEVVERLLAAGAEVDTPTLYWETALSAASGDGHLQVVERLLAAGADVDAPGSNGQTALWVASRGGYFQVVERLLAAGARVNAPNSDGRSTLCAASCYGHHQVVEQLLAAGVEAGTLDGLEALCAASEGGHLQVVEQLLAAGVEADTRAGLKALSAASFHGHLQVVERLLAAGADVQKNESEAYQVARSRGHHEVAARLRAAGPRSTSRWGLRNIHK